MKDMQTSLEKLRNDAALVRDLATEPDKKALYTLLAEHLSNLADEVERAIRRQHARS
jgi:hypothetical protein